MDIYVFDANTIVSAALNPNGTPRRALALARANGIIALSVAVFGEISEVLGRPKFSRALTNDRRTEILDMLSAAALWVDPKEKVRECRDPKDDRYLELASAVRAEMIISGDEDLLVLDPWRGIRVVRPSAFVERFPPAGLPP